MNKNNTPESFIFDSIQEAFKYFLNNIYPEIPPDVKRKNYLTQLKREHKRGSVSTKRMRRTLDKFVDIKLIMLEKQ